jgi:cyclase
MKLVVAFALGLAGTMAAVSPVAQAAAPAMAPVEITRTEIAPGIHQFTVGSDGYVEQLNSVAIVTDRDVILFDTTTRPSTAAAIFAQIGKITDKPVRYVANSHWHPDHWSGNEVFARAFPDLEIIATEQERNFMMNMAPAWATGLPRALAAQEKAVADEIKSGEYLPGIRLTPERRALDELDLRRTRDMVAEQAGVIRTFPTLTYTDRLTLYHGGRELRFISVTGDAAGTTVLYLPKEKILITGDAVSYPLPYSTPPLSAHSRSLRELARLDADIIIPGHGPAFRDKAYMLLEADLFDEVLRQVEQALRGGQVTIDQVQAAVKVDSFRERFAKGDAIIAGLFPQFVTGMVRRAYVELRDTKEIR